MAAAAAAPAHPDCVRCSSVFRKEWNLYQIMLDNDYMYHRELMAAVQQYLEGHIKGPFAMLDLGCGDSDYVARTLSNSPQLASQLQHYRGIDMSVPAMALSKLNMGRVVPGARIEHEEADLLQYVRTCAPPGSFDVVLASFALHHLTAQQKAEVTAAAAQMLRPGGVFCLVDVFLEPGEARPDFHRRFRAAIDSWSAMPERDVARITNHIEECDFPEHVPIYAGWMREAAPAARVDLLCERGGMFKAMAMQLPQTAA